MLKKLTTYSVAFVLGAIVAGGAVAAHAVAFTYHRDYKHPQVVYSLQGKSTHTEITRLVVRGKDCLNAEDSAATLRMIQQPRANGWNPAKRKVIYRCVTP